MRRVFLIGPAGVGKSTCGALLAPKLGFGFVDLDSEFNTRIDHIAEFIAREGYPAYCRRNVDLFEALLAEEESGAVYALSSGFLLYEDLDPSYSRLAGELRKLGVSILLLPAASVEEAAEITVGRLLARRPGLDAGEGTREVPDALPQVHPARRYPDHLQRSSRRDRRERAQARIRPVPRTRVARSQRIHAVAHMVKKPPSSTEELLQDWYRRARENQFAHYEAIKPLSSGNYKLGIPVAILSGLVGTSIFATLETDQADISLRIVFGIISILAAVLASLQTFLRLSERAEKHRAVAVRYGALRRELETAIAKGGPYPGEAGGGPAREARLHLVRGARDPRTASGRRSRSCSRNERK